MVVEWLMMKQTAVFLWTKNKVLCKRVNSLVTSFAPPPHRATSVLSGLLITMQRTFQVQGTWNLKWRRPRLRLMACASPDTRLTVLRSSDTITNACRTPLLGVVSKKSAFTARHPYTENSQHFWNRPWWSKNDTLTPTKEGREEKKNVNLKDLMEPRAVFGLFFLSNWIVGIWDSWWGLTNRQTDGSIRRPTLSTRPKNNSISFWMKNAWLPNTHIIKILVSLFFGTALKTFNGHCAAWEGLKPETPSCHYTLINGFCN